MGITPVHPHVNGQFVCKISTNFARWFYTWEHFINTVPTYMTLESDDMPFQMVAGIIWCFKSSFSVPLSNYNSKYPNNYIIQWKIPKCHGKTTLTGLPTRECWIRLPLPKRECVMLISVFFRSSVSICAVSSEWMACLSGVIFPASKNLRPWSSDWKSWNMTDMTYTEIDLQRYYCI